MGGRIVNVCVVVATGVNAEGQREILSMDVGASEDGAFWLAFLRSLTARGLSGVELVTSDAHQSLPLLTRVPKRAQPGVATMAGVGNLAHRPASVNRSTRKGSKQRTKALQRPLVDVH